jgi:hypothetical protein
LYGVQSVAIGKVANLLTSIVLSLPAPVFQGRGFLSGRALALEASTGISRGELSTEAN